MVLSPMMQIAAKLAQQFAPHIINGADKLFSGSADTPTRGNPSSINTSNHFLCPKCKVVREFIDVQSSEQLICSCGHTFPRIDGFIRCECGILLFPSTSEQQLLLCTKCSRPWKIKNTSDLFVQCSCNNFYEYQKSLEDSVTQCCETELWCPTFIPYRAAEPRVPSEAERNR